MSGARAFNCPECGGSGMRGSSDGMREFECFDCSGEGQWEAEDEAEQLTEVHSDPFLNDRRAA